MLITDRNDLVVGETYTFYYIDQSERTAVYIRQSFQWKMLCIRVKSSERKRPIDIPLPSLRKIIHREKQLQD